MNKKQRVCKHLRWKTKWKVDGVRKVIKCRLCGILKRLNTGELIEEALTMEK